MVQIPNALLFNAPWLSQVSYNVFFFLVDGEEMDTISPDHLSAMVNLLEKCAPSPRPNKTFSFAREPPDGCEKVKIIDEPRYVFLYILILQHNLQLDFAC